MLTGYLAREGEGLLRRGQSLPVRMRQPLVRRLVRMRGSVLRMLQRKFQILLVVVAALLTLIGLAVELRSLKTLAISILVVEIFRKNQFLHLVEINQAGVQI